VLVFSPISYFTSLISHPLGRADTQPTRSQWEMLPDPRTRRRVLGGARAGNGAWALAWIDTVMALPGTNEPPSPGAQERERIWKDVSVNQVADDLTMVS
jgi:chromatin structure-remodeling complex protein RSC7